MKRIPRAAVAAALLVGLLIAGAPAARAGISYTEHLMNQGKYAVIERTAYDVILVHIEKISHQDATNGNPPVVDLTVLECLRGNIPAGPLTAVWSPPPHSIDWGDGVHEPPELAGWRALPLPGPTPGDRMILVLDPGEGTEGRRISPAGRYPLTDATKKEVLEALKKAGGRN